MPLIFLILALMLIVSFSVNKDSFDGNNGTNKSLYTILIFAFLIRVVFALIFDGYETDMNCFNSWADMVYTGGFSGFYSSGSFTDYPPGYMYILYVIGFIKNTFLLGKSASYLLLKLPAIICDVVSGCLLYNIAKKENKNAGLISSLYLFNPVIILNSAIWGQVDSVFTLPVFLMLYLLMNKKLILSYFMFAIAIFIKPQALFYAPILLSAITGQVFLNEYSHKKFIKNLICGLLAIASLFVMAAPFGISDVVMQYQSTIASYDYSSVNAYNLWSALGLNWQPLNPVFSVLGYLFIATVSLLCIYRFFNMKSQDKYFYLSALICYSVFVLSVKMHERYAFPAILFTLAAFAISNKRFVLTIYGVLSSLLFFNIAHVLFYYDPATYYSSGFDSYSVAFGILSVIFLIVWWVYTLKKEKEVIKPEKEELHIKRDFGINKKDILIMCLITGIYSAVALFNLGDTKAPETYTKLSPGEEITIDMGKEIFAPELMFYNGYKELSDDRQITFSLIDENGEISEESTVSKGGVFSWKAVKTTEIARFIKVSATDEVAIFEIGIRDAENKLIPLFAPYELIDEQDLVPRAKTYKNSTYFDEIYHARTGYEFINGLPVYEWTHPPLGKIFISAGIKAFGMTPFGWRISGTLFGIFMIPVIYIFIKKMFGISWLSACGTVLLACDFMHFAQSRIATIDVYVTFFIMLMYLFMYLYYKDDLFLENRKKGHIILAFCGLFMGLGISSKWTGVYAGAGLAIIFALSLIKCYKKDSSGFIRRFTVTSSLCIVFFIIVPAVIYTLSYIPFLKSNGAGISAIFENQRDMFIYHGKTVVDSTHPFSSYWYEWIFDLRPIWYYSRTEDGFAESISAFGNPLIWWSGFVAFIYCLSSAVNKKDKKAVLLSIAYLSGIIPWTFVERTTFIYHYFPCVPFLILMICYAVDSALKYSKNAKKYFMIFTAISFILFIIFYPAISGLNVKQIYLELLKWLPRWQII